MSRNWIGEGADLAVGIVLRANYHRRPDCEDDWAEVCLRLDLELSIVDCAGPQRGCQLEDSVTVVRGQTCWQTCARICHEVVVYLVTTEMDAPYLYRPRPGVCYDQERHAIAKAAERRLGLGGRGNGDARYTRLTLRSVLLPEFERGTALAEVRHTRLF